MSDLCQRFLNRHLFKYVAFRGDEDVYAQIRQEMLATGIDPDYYLELDFPSDLPYDVYRPGESSSKAPILLLEEGGGLVEISRKSEVVKSISGVHQGIHKLYYPKEQMMELAGHFSRDVRDLLHLHAEH